MKLEEGGWVISSLKQNGNSIMPLASMMAISELVIKYFYGIDCKIRQSTQDQTMFVIEVKK